jgi:Tfp pilus assembly PilM family ATPase
MEKKNDANLICKIVATAVAASREAAKQLKYDLDDDDDDDDVLKDTVESKSLKIIIDYLCTSYPRIKYISKGNVSFFYLKLRKILR